MITFVPLPFYEAIYYYALSLVILIAYLQSFQSAIDDERNVKRKIIVGKILFGFVILYIGLRPVSGFYFGDMRTYAVTFEGYADGLPAIETKDWVFNYFMKFCSGIMTVEVFFLLCAFMYIIPLYVAVRRMFPEYWFYAFVMLVVSMSFWAYGTNGIRNGIATSFFILAMTRRNLLVMAIWMLIGVSFHKSLLIPIAAYIITRYHAKSENYLKIWLIAIPLSLILGKFWENFIMGLGLVENDRLAGYFEEDSQFTEQFSQTGFRWDFLLYSFTGVYAGWYFIIKKKFQDALYIRLYNIYLIANAFWILLIQATFSNRFAYLSWFLLGIVIIYPFLVNKFFEKQHIIVGRILLSYFMLSFILNVILG
ncbi:EpsG family protein [Flavobacterium sp. MAH-1]|uniref:EpsG family protein n=1 Tax=Flavobacterium agri TaxID=2743471 RepID=A0A7Y8Y1L6_9FLAO|nr:EpsG family protein [Flavobacterium agri]NUY80874.1 EpsG family protein [Flavobacterium agri]NYA70898.1 EpsG family protein [Flavobacterium agri]